MKEPKGWMTFSHSNNAWRHSLKSINPTPLPSSDQNKRNNREIRESGAQNTPIHDPTTKYTTNNENK
jgi:hypothetical protein